MTPRTFYIEDNVCTVYKIVLHKIQDTLEAAGLQMVRSPSEADLYLAALCASFDADEARSASILRRGVGSGKPVFVYGCLVGVDPARLMGLPAFASWDPGGLLHAILGPHAPAWDWTGLPNDFRVAEDYRVTDPTRRFVAISVGCNYECSYCPHRIGTGPLVSIPEQEIVDQVRTLEREGAQTIVLTGTDTACYGLDIGTSFAWLLSHILDDASDRVALHIAQFNPEGLFSDDDYTEDMLGLLSDPRIVDIQLPVQTASARLLNLMQRQYEPGQVADFIRRLRERKGRALLRTDLMVGFPTETRREFTESLEYVCENFGEVAVYAFEMKPGTPLAQMGLDRVPPDEVLRRRAQATEVIRKRGLLVHSGGQVLQTLWANDAEKARRTR